MVKILVADDTEALLDSAKINLEKEGYTVILAENGREAVNLALKENPDIIFLDAAMPEMDGWEAAQELKSNPATSSIPFIICSGDDPEEMSEKWKKLGARGYIVKPYNTNVLKEKITQVLGVK